MDVELGSKSSNRPQRQSGSINVAALEEKTGLGRKGVEMTLLTDKPKVDVTEPVDKQLIRDNQRFMTISLIVLAVALISVGIWFVFWGL